MFKNKGTITLIGFILAGIGFISLILALVGVQLSFLTWIDAPSRFFGFIMRIIFIVVGMVLIVLAQTDVEKET